MIPLKQQKDPADNHAPDTGTNGGNQDFPEGEPGLQDKLPKPHVRNQHIVTRAGSTQERSAPHLSNQDTI